MCLSSENAIKCRATCTSQQACRNTRDVSRCTRMSFDFAIFCCPEVHDTPREHGTQKSIRLPSALGTACCCRSTLLSDCARWKRCRSYRIRLCSVSCKINPNAVPNGFSNEATPVLLNLPLAHGSFQPTPLYTRALPGSGAEDAHRS